MPPAPPEIIPVTLKELDEHPDAPGHDDPRGYRLTGDARDMFRTNPFARPDDVVQLLARADGVILGRMNLLPGELVTPGGGARVGWGSGYAVDPAARGRGVGTALMRAMHGHYPALGALGASAMSEPIFRKLGWTLARAPRVVFVRRTRPVVRSKTNNALIAGVGAAVLDTAMRARHAWALRGPVVPAGYSVHAAEFVPDAYLPRGERGSMWYPRTGAWIEWMSRAVPRTETRRWAVCLVDRGGEPFGYFIVSDRFHETASRWGYRDLWLSTVKDWHAADGSPASARTVAEIAARHAMTRDVDAVEVCATDPELRNRLRALGGFVRGSSPLFMFADDQSVAPALEDPASWDFRSADGDYFMF